MRNYKKAGLNLSIGLIILFTTPFGYASGSGAGVCLKNDDAAFANADAVVMANVIGIEESAAVPPKHAINTINVSKFWKLKEQEIPRKVLSPIGIFETNSTYLVFLKKYRGDEYQVAACSPNLRITGSNNLNQIFFLNTQEVHDVD